MPRSQDAPTLNYLDLATPKPRALSEVLKINLLIRSLRDNYFAYGVSMAARNQNTQAEQVEKIFVIPRVNLPRMKEDSCFKAWQPFLDAAFNFFDGDDRTAYISELQQLDNAIRATGCYRSNELLEAILTDFETGSGFASVHTISSTDGNRGLLTPADFRKILAAGHPLNDCGASSNHGRLPHRLQFYIFGNYLLKNLDIFFSADDLATVLAELHNKYPGVTDDTGNYPISKIISAFYRMIGTDAFNDCFDWDTFTNNRYALNVKYNGTDMPDKLNTCDMWFQLFDRVGYAGYFSVPSTVGLLQKLGCFRSLPEISEPSFADKKELKTIFDITPKLGLL